MIKKWQETPRSNQESEDRENKAVKRFCDEYGLTFKNLGRFSPVDFIIYNNNISIYHLEVKGRKRFIKNAFPLMVSEHKRKHLQNYSKKNNTKPIFVWALFDGIICANDNDLKGTYIEKGGWHKARKGNPSDIEPMYEFQKEQNNFIILKY